MTETDRTSSRDPARDDASRSIPGRPLSRRALIKAAGIAPFIALATRAWAQPTPANMAAVAKVVPIPADQLIAVKAKVTAAFPTIDLNKFELVASAMWIHFYYGLGKVEVSEDLAPKLLMVMYDEPLSNSLETTGARVATNIVAGHFDPLGNDYQTNVCAYICGHKAATDALSQNKTKIDEVMYKAARASTQSEMSKKLTTARGGAGAASPHLGLGC